MGHSGRSGPSDSGPLAPRSGGKITSTPSEGQEAPTAQEHDFPIVAGGPEVIPNYPDRTLFLCYPDEDSNGSSSSSIGVDEDDPEKHSSMAAACSDYYTGDTILHVGELCLLTNRSNVLTNRSNVLSMDQAPWGRTSSPLFQERLMTEFHCILCAELRSQWFHTNDRLTVWKRSQTTAIVFFEGEEDDGDEEDVAYYR